MKRLFVIVFLLALCFGARAQQETIDASELLNSAQQFLQENEAELDALGIDTNLTQQFFAEVQTHFQDSYVYDLGEMRQLAKEWLPVLKQYEETADYAIWLESRLDYFDMAEQLRKEASVGKTNVTRLPDPSPQVQRKAWVSVVEKRLVPPLAAPHVAGLKKIFISERVPPQLVWIAEVESSFNPKAKSPMGAAGLFQLMPSTARSLDLAVGFLRDERLHPQKSGRAAAKYLAQLYKRFGDWRLALAAYNAGEGRVAELLKKSKTKSFDAIAHRLPSETQMYVPKVEAIVRKREGISLAELKLPKS